MAGTNFEEYRNKFEPQEHWNLKKEFMMTHSQTLDRDRLVTLAQAYANHIILGCVYHPTLMEQLRSLSVGLGRSYQNGKATRLRRTLVAASVAAKAKVCRSNEHKSRPPSRPPLPKSDLMLSVEKAMNADNNSQKLILVFDAFQTKSADYVPRSKTILSLSASKCKMNFTVEVFNDGFHVVKLSNSPVHKTPVHSTCAALGKKLLEERVTQSFLRELCKTSVLLMHKRRKHGDNVDIEDLKRNCEYIEAEGFTEISLFNDNLDENNVGTKIMKKMGWGKVGGTGLGKYESGTATPIIVTSCINRRGLGHNPDDSNKEFRSNIHNIMRDYSNRVTNSEQSWDLVFSPNFTKSQRAIIHTSIESYRYLKHVSHGNGERRYLVISPKMSLYEDLLNKLVGGDETEEYKIVAPGKYDMTCFGFKE